MNCKDNVQLLSAKRYCSKINNQNISRLWNSFVYKELPQITLTHNEININIWFNSTSMVNFNSFAVVTSIIKDIKVNQS